MSTLALRAWQSKFIKKLAAHCGADFLLVACPAAGKTRAGAAGASVIMERRNCDQLVVVCPTVVVRDQWARDLGELGYRMLTQMDANGWEPYEHGVCVTYAQVANCYETYARACAERRTVVIFDEIHHAGQQLAWGTAIERGFHGAVMRLMLSGTPFRSDRDRIPFIAYDDGGLCVPDFTYDYARAVADGVCRPIRFEPHDGLITWREGDGEQTAHFEEPVGSGAEGRRLRAALDPRQPYLHALLSAGHKELRALREKIDDAAGLVVCDSQQHAVAVDRLISRITGSLPVLAMSDIPRAHQAITAFATEPHDEWLVSVRMVSEGVDIPRLGVIVWATATTTELMVRQVAGRALRGRARYANLPAVVHMPADPNLVRYAQRLEVLAGPVPEGGGRTGGQGARAGSDTAAREIDPAPFLAWLDQQAKTVGLTAALERCGWDGDSGRQRIARWRRAGASVPLVTLIDACHMADVPFDQIYAARRYAKARAWVRDPAARRESGDYGAVAAKPIAGAKPRTLTPALPKTRPHAAGEQLKIAVPALPRSPQELRAEIEQREARRGELFRVLAIYHQLRRSIDPAYQLASAHRDLSGAVGAIDASSTDEQVERALKWIGAQVAQFAHTHPEQFKDLARAHRRLAIAS